MKPPGGQTVIVENGSLVSVGQGCPAPQIIPSQELTVRNGDIKVADT